MKTMLRPVPLLIVLAGALLEGAASAGEEVQAKTDAANNADVPATRETSSPLISSMISAGLPKYDESKSTASSAAPVEPAPPVTVTSSATIVHLPAVIVRDRKLPDKSEVLTKEEMTRQGMETYIGPENGIDRGVLNLFTVADLWQRLPFFGRYELIGFETNEQRGLRLYREAKRREEFEELNSLKTIGLKADGGAKAADK